MKTLALACAAVAALATVSFTASEAEARGFRGGGFRAGAFHAKHVHFRHARFGHRHFIGVRRVVVGGGGVGSSIAYHLTARPDFRGSVVVIERDPTYARASSALSASSIRQQFSTPLNIHLSRFGIEFLRQARERLGVDLGLREPGYLFLASPAGEDVLRANHEVQRRENCAVELLAPGFGWIINLLQIPLSDFSRGSPAQRPLPVAGEKVAVNICYEDAYGDEIARHYMSHHHDNVLGWMDARREEGAR